MKKIIRYIQNKFFITVLVFINKNIIGKNNRLNSLKIYNTKFGNFNYVGPGVIVNGSTIGNFCSIAAYTQIGGMEHDFTNFSSSTFLNKGTSIGNVIIQDDVWIGAACYIKSGTKIGKGSIIGAGSIVLNDIPPNSIAVGSPARVIKKRFEKRKYEYYMHSDFTDSLKNLKKLNESFNIRWR